ncbi:ATP-dependent DNA helicase pfh1 [Frankliniella fusca]|uniref:ATP-dependent DNA helicase n=1 Tax=Frankliniella fusca TaxID=407009 RepID=A0AAE1HHS7_9NEOP|nr:ATP-dependent DNA helicase pfh1 [Frankliniella fusca]
MTDKVPYIHELIRPYKVYQAAEYLTKTDVYIKHNIKLDSQWLQNTNQQCEIVTIDNCNIAVDDNCNDVNEVNLSTELEKAYTNDVTKNTLLNIFCDSDSDDSSSNESEDSNIQMQEQESMIIPENIPDHLTQDTGIKIAPGEGKNPISLLRDEDVDILTYPTIYAGKSRQFKFPLKDAELRKFELKSYDRRAANNIPKLFMSFCGVGKSTLLKALTETATRFWTHQIENSPDDIHLILSAPTGKAAFNIQGQTIHSIFGLGFDLKKELTSKMTCDKRNTLMYKLKKLKLMVIDEISMVSHELMQVISLRLQEIFETSKPFGGVSMIVMGDFNQLPPVYQSPVYQPPTDTMSILSNANNVITTTFSKKRD